MSEDEVLEEFGFELDEPIAPRGRGKVKNMLGKKSGLFVCVQRHTKNHKAGEVQWLLRCTGCGNERVERGSRMRAGRFRCFNCEGRPGNPKPSNIVDDWNAHFETLKQEMTKAIESGNDEVIPALARRLLGAVRRIASSNEKLSVKSSD